MIARSANPLWAACRRDFAPDGALRDIYVEDTDLADWERLLGWLRSASFALFFSHEGNSMPLPITAGEVFALSGTASSILTIQAGPLAINCHFFSDHEIELDLDPRQLTDEHSFAHLLGFVRGLGDALHHDVIVTHENVKAGVVLRYLLHQSEFEHELHA